MCVNFELWTHIFAMELAKVSSSFEQRHFVPWWKNNYPWILKGRMFCQFGADAFTTGCDKLKDSLQKHTLTQEHCRVVEAASCQKD